MREKILERDGWRIRVRPLRLRDSLALQAWVSGITKEAQGMGEELLPEAAGIAYLAGLLSACSDILAVPDGVDPDRVLWNVEAFLDMPQDLVEAWAEAALEVNPRLAPKETTFPTTTSGGTGSSGGGSTSSSSGASTRSRRRPDG
ncbi:MAG: hypothetical protein QN210_12325 [Armatimonadota bacterium]|nr:hypothetical protein [Armatimonadota bacterium]